MKHQKGDMASQIQPTTAEMHLYQAECGLTKVEVRLHGETIWMTQTTLTEWYQTSQQNITAHRKAICASG